MSIYLCLDKKKIYQKISSSLTLFTVSFFVLSYFLFGTDKRIQKEERVCKISVNKFQVNPMLFFFAWQSGSRLFCCFYKEINRLFVDIQANDKTKTHREALYLSVKQVQIVINISEMNVENNIIQFINLFDFIFYVQRL